jgi:DNA (cytosine-5)-methyltransferase 1
MKNKIKKTIKFIDLFAGMGGTRLGFESACKSIGVVSECVFTSEIKKHAIKVYKQNFDGSDIYGDITNVTSDEIPEFDFLLAGFPCQPFSSAGSRKGFYDTRGTLFFDIERIIKDKKPDGFLLENVEGIVKHDLKNKNDSVGNTLRIILLKLEEMGYQVTWKVLDATDFGIPQKRKRIYIAGTKNNQVSLEGFKKKNKNVGDILEKNKPLMDIGLANLLLEHFSPSELYGKAVKDKRGGNDNIHSWDIELKGKTTKKQRELLNLLLKERRKKHWAKLKGIHWMDGMPLTVNEIKSFTSLYPNKDSLKKSLDDLVKKGYLRYEHPKDLVNYIDENGNKIRGRRYIESKEKGYNIVSGKLSFEINKILDPNSFAPTLVATDSQKWAVVDGNGLRRLTIKEGLLLSGFPARFKMPVSFNDAFDLLGNTVMVGVVKNVCERILLANLDCQMQASTSNSSNTSIKIDDSVYSEIYRQEQLVL